MMSASRPILVVARVVEALPRLAADHVPHALAASRSASPAASTSGGQFAYYWYIQTSRQHRQVYVHMD